MNKTSLAAYAEPVARQQAESMGYTLIDAELVRESTGFFLRFYIDKDGGVSLDDCERFHRAVQPLMESVEYDYMEVSSPGADRPLKKPEDFEKAVGTRVEVKLYRAVDGAKRYEGELIGLSDGCVVIRCGERERSFPMKLVARVAPYIEFDEDAWSDVFEGET